MEIVRIARRAVTANSEGIFCPLLTGADDGFNSRQQGQKKSGGGMKVNREGPDRQMPIECRRHNADMMLFGGVLAQAFL
jgi:hypothetical protein